MIQLILEAIITLRAMCLPLIYHYLNMATISNNSTTKQKPHLNYNGYFCVMDRSTSEKTYWRCIKYSSDRCHSRLHTSVLTNSIVKPSTEHTCRVDGTTLEFRKFCEKIADRAMNTQETPDTIVTNCYRGSKTKF